MEDQVPDHDIKTGTTISIKGYEFIDLENQKVVEPYISVEEELEEQRRTIRGILILQKFEILNFAWCQIMPIGSLISELFLFLL